MFTVCLFIRFVMKGGKEVRIKFFIFIHIYIILDIDDEFVLYTFE